MGPPLKGQRILITREENQANVFASNVSQLGGIPVVVPLLKINCCDPVKNEKVFHPLSIYNWIFFTSANGVRCFFEQVNQQAIHELDGCRFAVVGHKTEQALNQRGFTADFIPSVYNAEVMAKEFLARYPSAHVLLLVRGNRSRSVLPVQFIQHGIDIDLVEVYETAYNVENNSYLNEQLAEKIDFITFTSPSTVDAFTAMVDDKVHLEKVCVCIGTTTEQRAREQGFKKTLMADPFTIEGMIDCIREYLARKG